MGKGYKKANGTMYKKVKSLRGNTYYKKMTESEVQIFNTMNIVELVIYFVSLIFSVVVVSFVTIFNSLKIDASFEMYDNSEELKRVNKINSWIVLFALLFFILSGVFLGLYIKESNIRNQEYVISYQVTDGGSLCIDGSYYSGGNIKVRYGENSNVFVVAVADNGYEFVKWSDGVIARERMEENVVSNINVVAIFKKIED